MHCEKFRENKFKLKNPLLIVVLDESRRKNNQKH